MAWECIIYFDAICPRYNIQNVKYNVTASIYRSRFLILISPLPKNDRILNTSHEFNETLTKRVAIDKIIEYYMRMFLDKSDEFCKKYLTDWVYRAF